MNKYEYSHAPIVEKSFDDQAISFHASPGRFMKILMKETLQ